MHEMDDPFCDSNLFTAGTGIGWYVPTAEQGAACEEKRRHDQLATMMRAFMHLRWLAS